MRRQIVDLSGVEPAKVACKASSYPDTQARKMGDVLTARRCTPFGMQRDSNPRFTLAGPERIERSRREIWRLSGYLSLGPIASAALSVYTQALRTGIGPVSAHRQ